MMRTTIATVYAYVLMGVLSVAPATAGKRSQVDFKSEVKPLLAKYCFRCHGDKKQSGDVALHNLDIDLVKGKDAETWHDVLNKLNRGEMPPEKALQPSTAEREKIVDWLTNELKRATAIKRSSGGRIVMRRLTRYEYSNTMRDLLGVDLDYASDLPPESNSRDGFRNNGSVLAMSPLQIEYYLKTARWGLSKAIVTGSQPQVFTHRATKSEKVGGRRARGKVFSNTMAPGGFFAAKLLKFPREGEFIIRVKARARIPKGAGYPRLSVSMGVRADVLAAKAPVGEVEIHGAPRVYEFRARMEDFPLPGSNPKFPGVIITLTHESKNPVNGGKKNRKNRKRKGKNKNTAPAKPVSPANYPVIVIESVDFKGPAFDAWPPSSHTRIFFPSKNSGNETVYSREVIQRFLRRAYRRPVTRGEVDGMMALFRKIRPKADSFEVAMREVLAMALISPDFLYLAEPRSTTTGNKKQSLTDHELAARLSYFLWSTMPDERLSKLAGQRETARQGGPRTTGACHDRRQAVLEFRQQFHQPMAAAGRS